MTENSVTQQEHEEFMRRAIELGAKGGLLERTGGKISNFCLTLKSLDPPPLKEITGSPLSKSVF